MLLKMMNLIALNCFLNCCLILMFLRCLCCLTLTLNCCYQFYSIGFLSFGCLNCLMNCRRCFLYCWIDFLMNCCFQFFRKMIVLELFLLSRRICFHLLQLYLIQPVLFATEMSAAIFLFIVTSTIIFLIKFITLLFFVLIDFLF